MKNTIILGIYKTTEKKFECFFIPSEKIVRVIELPQNIGYGKEWAPIEACSIHEACGKISSVLGPGSFKFSGNSPLEN